MQWKTGRRSSTSFSQGNKSAPSDLRPTSKAKVPASHLPVNTGSDRTKTKDFLKVKSARSVRRIAKARNSSEPHPVLQPGFHLHKRLDYFTSTEGLSTSTYTGHSGRLIVHIIDHLRLLKKLTPQQGCHQNWK